MRLGQQFGEAAGQLGAAIPVDDLDVGPLQRGVGIYTRFQTILIARARLRELSLV